MSKLRTVKEIDELKAQWLVDPCWDIEETRGFEAHKFSLRFWRIKQERKWEREEKERLELYAKTLGIPEKPQLARQILDMQREHIATMERLTDALDRIAKLENRR
jgi:hypothetical protein